MTPDTSSHLPTGSKRRWRTFRRKAIDRSWRVLIALAGGSIILALLAIFLYLLAEAAPLFKPVSAKLQVIPSVATDIATPAATPPQWQQLQQSSGFIADYQLVDGQKRYLILARRNGEACLISLTQAEKGCVQRLSLTDRTVELTTVVWLAGQQTLVSGDSSGQLKQWFLLPDTQGQLRLSWIKPFATRAAAVVAISPEQARSGFAVLDARGEVSVFYSTLSKPLWRQVFPAFAGQADTLQFTSRNNALWVLNQQQAVGYLAVDNAHPEISLRTLWQKVWYESWVQPEYVWQSSDGAELQQGKYSLVPLTIGTFKAAFYAMLVAVPLAVFAAIYCVCFLAEPWRTTLSHLIELMAMFPTVIIGFLAAIWLAPAVEQYLLALLIFIIITPITVFVLAHYWRLFPRKVQLLAGRGGELFVVFLLIFACTAIALWLGGIADNALFADGLHNWLEQHGVLYQQRNALVVGLAMGFAVMPVIFSLSYDALSQIPRQLALGAYALGATQWQIVQKVLLPLASPGILAAVMLGFSRAIGETMIILMATGNNPISNFNVFEGLRSLTATLTIELPEAAVDSSHYRVLFLAAIILFVFTFLTNTLADLVRQHLRRNLQRLES